MVAFAWEWLTVTGASTWLYRGGFLLCDLGVGMVIMGVTLVPDGLPAPSALPPTTDLRRPNLL